MIDKRARRGAQGADPGDWWAVDREILECLAGRGAMTPAELSRELGLSEGEATSLLAMQRGHRVYSESGWKTDLSE